MRENGKISLNQYVWLLFSIITSFSTLQIVGMLIAHAGRDTWLSVILAWASDVTLAVVYAYLGKRFPGETMVQYSMSILGKVFGRIVGALFSLFFLLAASGLLYSLCSLLTRVFYLKTDIRVLVAICFILVAVGAKKGLETFARTSEILGPVYLLSFIVLFVLAIPLVKPNMLKPAFYDGLQPSMTGSMFLLSYISICIMMGMYIPNLNNSKDGFKGKFISVSLGSAMLMLQAIFGICIFGSKEAGNMVNVGLMIARNVSIGDTIQRLEAVWLMISIAAGIMSAVSLIWAFSSGLSQVIGLNSYKPIVYPAALLAFVISVTSFTDDKAMLNFANYVFPLIALVVESGLEILLLIAALLLKKGGNSYIDEY